MRHNSNFARHVLENSSILLAPTSIEQESFTFTMSMLWSLRCISGPIPESMSNFGLSNAPAAKITSFRALIINSRLLRKNLTAFT